MSLWKDQQNSRKTASRGTTRTLAVDDESQTIHFGGLSSIGLSCCNVLGIFDLKYNSKSNTLFVQPKKHMMILFFFLFILYFLPLTLCPSPYIYSNDQNITHYNQVQMDGYRSHFGQNDALFEAKTPIKFASHLLSSLLTTSKHVTTSLLQLIPESIVLGTEQWLGKVARDAEFKMTSEAQKNQGKSSLFTTILHHILDNAHKIATRYHSIVYNTQTDKHESSTPSSFFHSTASPRSLSQKTITAVCSSLYNTQSTISYTLHTALTWIVDKTINLLNFTTLFHLDSLECFPSTIHECGYHHLYQRLSHITIPSHPAWPLYRFGTPLVSALYNFLNMVIPPDSHILMRSTAFLQTSSLRAAATLEIADAIHWYESGYLYGNPVQLTTLNVPIVHNKPTRSESYIEHDHLTWKRGVHIEDLATLTCTNAEALQRLLRALASIGCFSEISPSRWINTQVSLPLRRPPQIHAQQQYHSLAWAVMMFGNEQFVAQSHLASTIETGAPSFTSIYGDFWDYHHTSKELYLLYQQSMQKGASNSATANSQQNVNDSERVFAHADYSTQMLLGSRVGRCAHVNTGKSSNTTQNVNNASDGDTVAPTEHGAVTVLSSRHTLESVQKLPFRTVIEAVPTLPSTQTQPPSRIVTNNKNPMVGAYLEFNNAMEAIATTSVTALATDSAYFHDFDTLIDVAGGKGHLIHAILKENQRKFDHSGHISTNISRAVGNPSIPSSSKIDSELYDSLSSDNPTSRDRKPSVGGLMDKILHFVSILSQKFLPSSISLTNRVKLTTAVVFDLPYTYENQDTVLGIQHHVSSIFHDNSVSNSNTFPSSNHSNNFLPHDGSQMTHQSCLAIHHLPSQETSVSIPLNYAPQYQPPQNSNNNLISTLSHNQQLTTSNPDTENKSVLNSHFLPLPTQLCTGFTIHTGSFFNATSLPQSFVLNRAVIISKFASLLKDSSIFSAYLNYLSPTMYQSMHDAYKRAAWASTTDLADFIRTIPKSTENAVETAFLTQFTPYLSPSSKTFSFSPSELVGKLKFAYPPHNINHDNHQVVISKTLPTVTMQFLSHFFTQPATTTTTTTTAPSASASASTTQPPHTTFHVLQHTGYMMMQILHDWNDVDSISILSNLKSAASTLPSVPPVTTPVHTPQNNGTPGNPTTQQPSTATFSINLLPKSEQETYATLCYYAIQSHYPSHFAEQRNHNDILAYFMFQFINTYCNQAYHTPSAIAYHTHQSTTRNQENLSTSPTIPKPYTPISFGLTHNKKIIVIDRLLPETPQNIIADHGGAWGDILMMNNFNNAKERRVKDFSRIFEESGLLLTRVIKTRLMYSIVEAVVP